MPLHHNCRSHHCSTDDTCHCRGASCIEVLWLVDIAITSNSGYCLFSHHVSELHNLNYTLSFPIFSPQGPCPLFPTVFLSNSSVVIVASMWSVHESSQIFTDSILEMVEGRYSLRRKLNPTPKSKISERVLSIREKRTPTVSPALSSVLPLPPQPDFASSTRSDPPASPEQPGNAELESAAAQVDYWLGPGASDDIASMCVDAELSPEEDFVGSSMDEAPLSAISALGLAFNPDGNATPERNTCPPTPDMNVFSPAPIMDEPSMEEGSHTSNPFPPLNPYPEYIFPTAPLIDQPLTTHEPLFDGTVADEEPNYDIPADDEDPLFFPDSDFSALGDDSTKENSPHQGTGRISQVKWEILNTGFQKIDNLIDNIATETGRTRENVITLWKRSHVHECSRSVWNKYQRYFLENRRLERQRIGDPSASCKWHFL